MKSEDIIKIIELIQKFNIYHILCMGALVIILFLGYAGWVHINIKRNKAIIELEHERKLKELEYLEEYKKRGP